MSDLYFVSHNEGKIREAQNILGIPLKIINIELDEIQSLDLVKIVTGKAEQAFQKVKKPLLVDDAGLYIDAWNGFPGPFIKFIHDAGGSDLLLRMLQGEPNRKATFKATIGYHDGMSVHVFTGHVNGVITNEKKGENGWGFDPVFQPEGKNETFSQMKEHEKNAISHRKKALEHVKLFLEKRSI